MIFSSERINLTTFIRFSVPREYWVFRQEFCVDKRLRSKVVRFIVNAYLWELDSQFKLGLRLIGKRGIHVSNKTEAKASPQLPEITKRRFSSSWNVMKGKGKS
jgi:hypothetical protein